MSRLKAALIFGAGVAALSLPAALWVRAGVFQPHPVLTSTAGTLAVPARHRWRRHRHGLPATQETGVKAQTTPVPPIRQAGPEPAAAPAAGRPSQAPEPAGPPPPPATWSDSEIRAGRADCARRLLGLHAVFEESPPLKDGVCGTPAPIRLDAFDAVSGPRLSFNPPPELSCKLAEALHRWIEDTVQPVAKKHLQAAIVRIGNLASYQCRSRYDDPALRISEHAFANAIDIHEFITAKGERITVLDHWAAADEQAAFLHDIHAGACAIFGTTLGPEANEAHKNHFHLDMKERRKPLCDFTPEQERARTEQALRGAAVSAGPGGSGSGGTASSPAAVSAPVAGSASRAGETPSATEERKPRHRRRQTRRYRWY